MGWDKMFEPCSCGDPFCPHCGSYSTQGGGRGAMFTISKGFSPSPPAYV